MCVATCFSVFTVVVDKLNDDNFLILLTGILVFSTAIDQCAAVSKFFGSKVFQASCN